MPSVTPKVSVVIPAYNYGRYLRDAINSALTQTFADLEVLVVDDGSTDDTASIVRTYADPRVRYIYQANAGLSAARNTGIREACAPFIALLDADDMWLPEMLARAMTEYATLPADVGLLACASDRVDAAGVPLGGKMFAHGLDRWWTAGEVLLQSRFMPSTAVARREAYALCGDFDTALRSSEDRDMWIRIGTRFRIRYLGAPMVLIRKHSSNMSKHADRMRLNMRRVIGKAYAARVVAPWNVVFWLRVLSIFYFQNAWMQFDEGRYWKAVRDGAASLLLWPWFPDRRDLNEPALFRIRGLYRFAIAAVSSLFAAQRVNAASAQ